MKFCFLGILAFLKARNRICSSISYIFPVCNVEFQPQAAESIRYSYSSIHGCICDFPGHDRQRNRDECGVACWDMLILLRAMGKPGGVLLYSKSRKLLGMKCQIISCIAYYMCCQTNDIHLCYVFTLSPYVLYSIAIVIRS